MSFLHTFESTSSAYR